MIRRNSILTSAILFLTALSALAQGFKLQTLYTFSASPRNPQAGLVLGPDGNLYGTTYGGGAHSLGTVFKVTTNGVLATLASFNNLGGQNPFGGLVRGADGFYYGTTWTGGSGDGYGTVFQISSNGNLNSLASFANTNGANPEAGMIQASDGNFYGTTTFGGTNGYGALYRFMTNGTLTALVSFNANFGTYPQDTLVQGVDGGLYGTTFDGGANSNGTIFKFTTNGAFTVLDSFGGTSNACISPIGGLVQGADGYLYGTTTLTGVAGGGWGTVFKVWTNGNFTNLVSFNNTNNGARPEASLIQAMDGFLYGTTITGGTNGYGTVFKISTNGALSTLASFNNTNGAYPRSALVQAPDGFLYGTTQAGGTNGGGGTVFRISTNGVLTSLFSFNTDGAEPLGTLALGTNGFFYGTTSGGGSNDFGSVFTINTNGAFNTIASFAGTNGFNPNAGLLLAKDGNFYGTTVQGGTNTEAAYGTVFKMTPGGALTSLASFNVTDGAYPYGGLCETPDGSFYGTASQGGTNDDFGTIFKLAPNGVLTAPLSFNGADGNSPYGSLLLASDGNLYGTTEGNDSGTYLHGTVFQFNTNNNALTTLLGFDFDNGAYPFNGLVQGPDGYLYGATYSGGAYSNYGAIFQIPLNAAFTNVIGSFNNTNGANPYATLLAGPGGSFYGTTYNGGVYNQGTAFKITTNGMLASLVSFNDTNGANPYAGLTLGPDGNLYGVTEFGGNGVGTVFRLLTEPEFTNIVHQANGSILLNGDGGPFSQKYRLWASGNVALPFLSWTLVQSNSFDADGNFSDTDASPGNTLRFYRLTIP